MLEEYANLTEQTCAFLTENETSISISGQSYKIKCNPIITHDFSCTLERQFSVSSFIEGPTLNDPVLFEKSEILKIQTQLNLLSIHLNSILGEDARINLMGWNCKLENLEDGSKQITITDVRACVGKPSDNFIQIIDTEESPTYSDDKEEEMEID